MSQDDTHTPINNVFRSAVLSAALVSGIFFSEIQPAQAAKSGGRSSGRSFSSPSRSYSAPRSSASSTRLYSAPAVVVPVSPFGYGFSPFGGFYSPFGFGFGYGSLVNPLDLVVAGVVVWGVLQLVRGVSSSGQWASLDDTNSSLGRGVSVFKIQMALNCPTRGYDSLLSDLKRISTQGDTSSREGMSSLVNEIALCLLRRSSDWQAAASSYEHFKSAESEQAESAFNRISVTERAKLEKETISNVGGVIKQNEIRIPQKAVKSVNVPSLAVVTVAVAIRGDSLRNFSSVSRMSDVKSALQALASDVLSDFGDNVLGVEVLWTPEDPSEVMLRQDVITDFPELIDL